MIKSRTTRDSARRLDSSRSMRFGVFHEAITKSLETDLHSLLDHSANERESMNNSLLQGETVQLQVHVDKPNVIMSVSKRIFLIQAHALHNSTICQ